VTDLTPAAIPPCTPGRQHRWTELEGFGWFNSSSVWRCDCGLVRILECHGSTPLGGINIYARIEVER